MLGTTATVSLLGMPKTSAAVAAQSSTLRGLAGVNVVIEDLSLELEAGRVGVTHGATELERSPRPGHVVR